MNIEPWVLYERIRDGRPPLILDVRPYAEVARRRIEGRVPVESLHLPYSEFIEFEAECVWRVKQWLSGRDLEVVVVCAKGNLSEEVARALGANGVNACVLRGGMTAWDLSTVFVPVPAQEPLEIWQGVRFGKGCYSYVIASAREAVVVDPHRDVAAYRAFLRDHGLVLRGVFDTHLHSDHLSGGVKLAESPNVPYHVHAMDFQDSRLPFSAVWDGFLFRVGQILLEARHAPGHTPGSVLLLVGSTHVLTGDTLFATGAGRPDLGSLTVEWGRELHRTLAERIAPLEDSRVVLPAHAAGPADPGRARLGDLRAEFAPSREEFVRALAADVPKAPHEQARIRLANLGLIHPYEEEIASLEAGGNEGAILRRRP